MTGHFARVRSVTDRVERAIRERGGRVTTMGIAEAADISCVAALAALAQLVRRCVVKRVSRSVWMLAVEWQAEILARARAMPTPVVRESVRRERSLVVAERAANIAEERWRALMGSHRFESFSARVGTLRCLMPEAPCTLGGVVQRWA